MNLKNFKLFFSHNLKNKYSAEEIDSLYFNIIEFYLGVSKIKYIQNPLLKIPDLKFNELSSKIELLKNNTPIQYILGEVNHKNLVFKITKDVLIPRPETLELCDWIISSTKKKCDILDIGTGSGLIAIILKKYVNQSRVFAWDNSIKALEIAKKNSLDNNLEINFKELDILKKIQIKDKFDVIVSNPPYVDKSEILSIDDNVKKFEPHSAIFVENDDNLIFYKKIIEFSKVALNRLGVLYLECHSDRIKSVSNLLKINNFRKIKIREDLYGRERMIKAFI